MKKIERVTMKKTIRQQRKEQLKEWIPKLIKNGFRVFQYKDSAWFHFAKNEKIAYVQLAEFYGIHFSSVRKPSREHGTGTALFDVPEDELTINHFKEALDRSYSDSKRYPKYRYNSPDDWFSNIRILRETREVTPKQPV